MSDPRPLTESARVVLARVRHELSKGFTGEFRLRCIDGGVRDVEQVERWGPTTDNGTREKQVAS